MLSPFEASLMQMLIDKFGVTPEQVGTLLAGERSHGGHMVFNAVAMKLADGRRLCHLLCQYWEKPFFDLSFPYKRFLSHASRPLTDILRHDLLPLDYDDESVTVVACYVPESAVLDEVAERLGRSIILLLAEAEQVHDALIQMHDRIRRLTLVGTRDCGLDKRRFVELAGAGWPAVVHEHFAGGAIRVEFDRDGNLTKTLESLDPSEPRQLVDYLVGKTMTHHVYPGEDLGELVNSFVQSIAHFEGELKEAILRLRMAPMLLEDAGN